MADIDSGARLPCPKACPPNIHGLMMKCWQVGCFFFCRRTDDVTHSSGNSTTTKSAQILQHLKKRCRVTTRVIHRNAELAGHNLASFMRNRAMVE